MRLACVVKKRRPVSEVSFKVWGYTPHMGIMEQYIFVHMMRLCRAPALATGRDDVFLTAGRIADDLFCLQWITGTLPCWTIGATTAADISASFACASARL